jgi:hypothetical protein
MKQITIKNLTITLDDTDEEIPKKYILEWVGYKFGVISISDDNPLIDTDLRHVEVNYSSVDIKKV